MPRPTVVANEAEAEVLCSLLRNEGIDSVYKKTDFAAAAWTASFGSPVEVWVGDEDLARAKELLSSDE